MPDMTPLGSIIPPAALGLGRTIYGEGIIPPRFPVPPKVTGLPIDVTLEAIALADKGALMRHVDEKLRLEDERVRRILPALPAGYSWRGEIETREHVDFTRLDGEITMRVVYRLHGPDGERLDISVARSMGARDVRRAPSPYYERQRIACAHGRPVAADNAYDTRRASRLPGVLADPRDRTMGTK